MTENGSRISVFTFTHPDTGEELHFVPSGPGVDVVRELVEWAHEQNLPVGDCETRPPLTGSMRDLAQGYN